MKIDDFRCKGCNQWKDVFQKGSQKGYCLVCKPRPSALALFEQARN